MRRSLVLAVSTALALLPATAVLAQEDSPDCASACHNDCQNACVNNDLDSSADASVDPTLNPITLDSLAHIDKIDQICLLPNSCPK